MVRFQRIFNHLGYALKSNSIKNKYPTGVHQVCVGSNSYIYQIWACSIITSFNKVSVQYSYDSDTCEVEMQETEDLEDNYEVDMEVRKGDRRATGGSGSHMAGILV